MRKKIINDLFLKFNEKSPNFIEIKEENRNF